MSSTLEPHFSYRFEDIGDSKTPSYVRVVKHHLSQEAYVRVAIKDTDFSVSTFDYMPSIIADCTDIALAVYIADRFSSYYQDARTHVHIELPLRHPEVWDSLEIKSELEGVLNWFTHHLWTFQFLARDARPRLPEIQSVGHFSQGEIEVNLWSGGLDAFAGLCTRLSQQPHTRHVLFGTGGDLYIEHVQKSLSAAVSRRTEGRVDLIQVPLRLRHESANHMSTNSSQRSRGFVFLLLGAAAAYLQGQDTLFVYENGNGAINLTYSRSQEGRSQNVAVHPLSLQRMSALVSKVLGKSFMFLNPFVTATKAEMCQAIRRMDLTDLVKSTISCDSRRRSVPMQCGCCSSCLLRRQSLITAGIPDETHYGVLAKRDSSAAEISGIPGLANSVYKYRPQVAFHSDHLKAMLKQIDSLKSHLNSSDPWRSMTSEWKVLRKIVDQTTLLGHSMPLTEDQILSLYKRYSDEWSDPYVEDSLWVGLSDKIERYAYP